MFQVDLSRCEWVGGKQKEKETETAQWKISLGIIAYYLSLESHSTLRHVIKSSSKSCSKTNFLMLHNSMFLQTT